MKPEAKKVPVPDFPVQFSQKEELVDEELSQFTFNPSKQFDLDELRVTFDKKETRLSTSESFVAERGLPDFLQYENVPV